MKEYQGGKKENENILREDPAPYGNAEEQEEARLLRVMNMTDMEKLKSFTQMLRRNALFKKAKVTHKD
ncbi:hypothetical protein D3H65_26395 [Paraflavitalea soli]|uniref:Uncharacterized protein n=1 Tax=Paraflavitalea soli TaxID=2315862 RepID=A0A3B7MZX8_9BACT|nr:hypothetical protein [Paraflavitalea soli]AXY77295.1 hypothetical protein D3H65_26395 [Paraflavitalea soli]